jgi:hypothetical protein
MDTKSTTATAAKPSAVAIAPIVGADIERVLIDGDLSRLSPDQRVAYYKATCESLGLNSLTRPMQYIVLNGKLTLYVRKEATDQIRELKGVSIDKPVIEFQEGLCIVSVTAHNAKGRTDSDLAAVYVDGLKGADRANAIMKAITKGKRRVTLSICGLGFPAEEEIDERRDVRAVTVDDQTGEIIPPTPKSEWVEEIDATESDEMELEQHDLAADEREPVERPEQPKPTAQSPVGATEFFRAAEKLGLPLANSRKIRDAYTLNGKTDWANAIKELPSKGRTS